MGEGRAGGFRDVRWLEGATSIAELKQMITARAAELDLPAGEFITCVGGWNIDGLGGNLPTLDDLDAAAPHNPVYLSTTGPGGAVTNTLGKAFFTTRTPQCPSMRMEHCPRHKGWQRCRRCRRTRPSSREPPR